MVVKAALYQLKITEVQSFYTLMVVHAHLTCVLGQMVATFAISTAV